ncbi:alpha/beta fold hydrolase [Streptomyces sp. NPDC002076]
MTDLVLVAGAWLGAWAWDEVAADLRAAGHEVHALTLSGLAEKKELPAGQRIHVQDIVDEVERLDLRDVVLVGHSYSGVPVGQAAERIGDRLRRVVFVDSNVPADGVSFLDDFPQRPHPCRSRRARRRVAAPASGGLREPGPHRRTDRPSHRRGHPAPGRHADRTGRAEAPTCRAAGDVHQVPPGRPRSTARRDRGAARRTLGAGRARHRPLADVLHAP